MKFSFTPLTILIAVCVIAGTLALLTQYIPLNEISLLNAYVEIAIKLTTSGAISVGSTLPDATKVYYSFAWLMFPLLFILCWKWGATSDGKYDTLLFVPLVRLTIWKRLILLLLTPLWGGLCIGLWYAFDGGDSRLANVGSSLVTLVCFGWVVPGAMAAAAFLFIASIKKSITGKI